MYADRAQSAQQTQPMGRSGGGGAVRRGSGGDRGGRGGPGRRGRGRGGGGPNGSVLNRLGPKPGDGVVVFDGDRDGDAPMGDSAGSATAQPMKKGFDPYGGSRRRVVDNAPNSAGSGSGSGSGQKSNGFGPMIGEGGGQRKPGNVDVAITGWSPRPNATRQQLIQFVRRRCQRNLNISQVRTTDGGTTVVLTVGNWAEASALQRLSGSSFQSFKLSFDPVQSSEPKDGPQGGAGPKQQGGTSSGALMDRIPVLREYLKFQYAEQIHLLDLSGMANNPAIREAELHDLNNEKVGGVLCKMIGEEFPGIQSIALNSNRLASLNSFRTLFQKAPSLVNLSLEQNNLNSLRDLEAIKNAPLRELRLRGNPVYDRDAAKHVNHLNTMGMAGSQTTTTSKKFRENVLAMFPTLMILDDESIEEGPDDGEITFGGRPSSGASAAAVGVIGPDSIWPIPIKKGWVDSEGTAEVVEDFLSKFFPLFDSNRAALGVFYHQNAVFSMASNTHVPPFRKPSTVRSRSTGQLADDMSGWQAVSRNFTTLREPARRLNTLACGPEAIVAAIKALPHTRHTADRTRKVVDSWMQQDPATGAVKLFVSVHGEFIEVKMNLSKSYDRLFIIAPAREGSPAQQAGYRFEVLNDQLTVRPWSQNFAWRDALEQGAQVVAPAPAPPVPLQPIAPLPVVVPVPEPVLPVAQVPVPPGMDPLDAQQRKVALGLDDLQHAKVLTLSAQTNLTYNYSCQCLVETQWDFDRALAAFNAVKHQVPPDGFIVR
ncbi:hypothetical protein M427DRAFT_133866 [Gonapodya prolifera JEL478]|uniref:NTF2-like protein n=1 Tax=Gonapodya prolifera (strain JEL478) TaxID=1344416 RepID=A0A139AJ96_GONPJ|nr:hypothetical protein M427DRAFT_133866 [Gonapodya prolifera JEL478]|eukprot:KXS16788.1 hypothetical protein M427DRAFT_133866 [Gonapodya prolifera JEL478]